LRSARAVPTRLTRRPGSTWPSVATANDGSARQVLTQYDGVTLLVPSVVIDEFGQNRKHVEASMTASVEQRFRLIKRDLGDYGRTDHHSALRVLEELAHEVPLIGAMTTRSATRVTKGCVTPHQRHDPANRATCTASNKLFRFPCCALAMPQGSRGTARRGLGIPSR
jgi:hypothetical protein